MRPPESRSRQRTAPGQKIDTKSRRPTATGLGRDVNGGKTACFTRRSRTRQSVSESRSCRLRVGTGGSPESELDMETSSPRHGWAELRAVRGHGANPSILAFPRCLLDGE